MNLYNAATALSPAERARETVDRMCVEPFSVVMADDSEDDRWLLQRAMRKSPCLRLVAALTDGGEVIEYLRGAGDYGDRGRYPMPDLLLLDIEMPGMTGLQVLEWVRSNEVLFPHLRVVMLSGSLSDSNIERALNLGADYYQAKGSDFNALQLMVSRVELLMALLHGREPRPKRKDFMSVFSTLSVIDGRGPPCDTDLNAAADTKRNFILILNSELELEKLWDALGTTTIVPDRLHRWGVLAMAEALTLEDYTLVLGVQQESAVYLIEQLTLSRNIPPRTKPVMLYCELRGIIGEFHSVEQAGVALLGYLDGFKRARLLPLAGIYEYDGSKWMRVKKLSSV